MNANIFEYDYRISYLIYYKIKVTNFTQSTMFQRPKYYEIFQMITKMSWTKEPFLASME